MSDDGGFDDVDEFFFSRAISSLSFSLSARSSLFSG
jgi:hypothetical protein